MASTITVTVVGGPTITVPWTAGMNAEQALEGAYNVVNNRQQFTYELQYFGAKLGYLVVMINDTYETFESTSAPNYYWEFLVNGNPAQSGIDQTTVNNGDVLKFELEAFVAQQHAKTTVGAKHAAKTRSGKS